MIPVGKSHRGNHSILVSHSIITVLWHCMSVNRVRCSLSGLKGKQQNSVIWSVMEQREIAHEVLIAKQETPWCSPSYTEFQLSITVLDSLPNPL